MHGTGNLINTPVSSGSGTLLRPPETDPEQVNSGQIKRAAATLEAGGVVAFPTETSYGLGALADHEAALNRIYEIKKRPADKPLLVIISAIKQLSGLASEIPPVSEILMEKFWPGPLTILFPAVPGLPWPLHCGTGKVGVRISDNPWALELCKATGRPVTATSANLSGHPPAVSAREVQEQLSNPAPDFVLDGGSLLEGTCSTIVSVDAVTGHAPTGKAGIRIVREGVIPSAEIFKAVGRKI